MRENPRPHRVRHQTAPPQSARLTKYFGQYPPLRGLTHRLTAPLRTVCSSFEHDEVPYDRPLRLESMNPKGRIRAGAGLVPVCRFFTVAFPPTSSHFYAPRGLCCEGTLPTASGSTKARYSSWAAGRRGKCPSGFVPVFRLYNNLQGGAPNHRLTTDDASRTQMLTAGYVAEGAGVGVGDVLAAVVYRAQDCLMRPASATARLRHTAPG